MLHVHVQYIRLTYGSILSHCIHEDLNGFSPGSDSSTLLKQHAVVNLHVVSLFQVTFMPVENFILYFNVVD